MGDLRFKWFIGGLVAIALSWLFFGRSDESPTYLYNGSSLIATFHGDRFVSNFNCEGYVQLAHLDQLKDKEITIETANMLEPLECLKDKK